MNRALTGTLLTALAYASILTGLFALLGIPATVIDFVTFLAAMIALMATADYHLDRRFGTDS